MAILDPKLDRLPEDAAGDFANIPEHELTEEQRTHLHARRGLSINDTIAADANMSVGARGVGVSGVESGAGAGADMVTLTPGESGPTTDEIAERAYRIWNDCGCPHGSHDEHWYQAERELMLEREGAEESSDLSQSATA